MACQITTPRLVLAPLGPEHVSTAWAGWLNDPHIMRYSRNGGQQHTPESCAAYGRGFDHETRLLWAVTSAGDGHVGNINAYVTPADGVADIGLLIGSGAGRGYGQEAWEGVMQALFTHCGMRKVTGGCVRDHGAMRRIMQRAGMQPDGERIGHILLNGHTMDIVHYAQFHDTFTPRSDITCGSCPAPTWPDQEGSFDGHV